MLELSVFEDKEIAGDWRVEYVDDDGACYVNIFVGPNAEHRARDYHRALKTGVISPQTAVTRPKIRG
jgi:hypothetical protein